MIPIGGILETFTRLYRRILDRVSLPALIVGMLGVTAFLARMLGQGQEMFVLQIIILSIGSVLALVVWFNPYVGLAIIMVGLPMQGVLAQIPFGTMLSTAMGGLSLIAFIYHRKDKPLFSHGAQLQFVLAAGFVLWQLVRYPEASVYYGGRNYLFTYIQLWSLMWLASEILTVNHQLVIMRFYVVAGIISALVAFSQANIVADFSAGAGLERGEGLAENQNSLAFYLVLGVAMATFLHSRSKHPAAGVIYSAIYVSLILGVVGTVSRFGFLSLIMTLIFTVGFWMRSARERIRQIIIPLLVFVFAVLYFIPGAYWEVMQNTIFTGDIQSEGNLGSRAQLMETGIEVWKDNPAFGVGMGQFRRVSKNYLNYKWQHLAGLVQHNFYVELLAETGLIGFLLFLGWIVAAMRDLWRTMQLKSDYYSPIATIWLIMFVVFLFRGSTASTMHYDKLLFLMGGISVAIYQGALAQKRKDLKTSEPTP